MPGKRSRTVEEQILDLEAQKARIKTDNGDGRKALLRLEIQIQELRDLDKRRL